MFVADSLSLTNLDTFLRNKATGTGNVVLKFLLFFHTIAFAFSAVGWSAGRASGL